MAEKTTKTQSKIQDLQDQYKSILVDAIKDNAEECVDTALSDTDGQIGLRIRCVIRTILARLGDKIKEELGLSEPKVVAVGLEVGTDVDTSARKGLGPGGGQGPGLGLGLGPGGGKGIMAKMMRAKKSEDEE